MMVVPAAMREAPRWIRYDADQHRGTFKKPVHPQVDGPFYRHLTRTSDWVRFEEIFVRPRYQPGFMPGGGFVVLDLDKVLDDDGRIIQPWVEKLVARAATYTEVSVRGHGLHLWFKGEIEADLSPGKARAELYGQPGSPKKYIATTGKHWPGSPLALRADQEFLDWLYAHLLESEPAEILRELGMAINEDETQLGLTCPWEASHSTPRANDYETALLLDGNGKAVGFHCFHNCSAKWSIGHVKQWLRIPFADDADDEQEVLVPTAIVNGVSAVGPYSVTLSSPRWVADGLKATLKVSGPLGGLHEGDIILSSIQAKDSLIRFLNGAAKLPNGKWATALGLIFAGYLDQERKSVAPQRLMDIELPTDEVMANVKGVSYLPRHHSLYFGQGESYKSLVALWVAGQSGRKTLYVDWELSGGDHRKRLEGLFGLHLPSNVYYVKSKLPFAQSVNNLKRIVDGEGIELLVIDSVAFSTNLPAETSEAALVHFGTLEEIGIGSISIGHTTKTVRKADRGREKPFGSTFWHNAARFTLLFERQQSGTVILTPRKSNLDARPPDVELIIKFGKDGQIDIKPLVDTITPMSVEDYVLTHPGQSKTSVAKALGGRKADRFDEIDRLLKGRRICCEQDGQAERLKPCVS